MGSLFNIEALKTYKNRKIAAMAKIQEFEKYLNKREFYCYFTKKLKEIRIEFGASAAVSDQGSVPFCASHAVGKCVVDIIDGFGLDCDQDKVIQTLAEAVQSDGEAHHIQEFNDELIDVEVWEQA